MSYVTTNVCSNYFEYSSSGTSGYICVVNGGVCSNTDSQGNRNTCKISTTPLCQGMKRNDASCSDFDQHNSCVNYYVSNDGLATQCLLGSTDQCVSAPGTCQDEYAGDNTDNLIMNSCHGYPFPISDCTSFTNQSNCLAHFSIYGERSQQFHFSNCIWNDGACLDGDYSMCMIPGNVACLNAYYYTTEDGTQYYHVGACTSSEQNNLDNCIFTYSDAGNVCYADASSGQHCSNSYQKCVPHCTAGGGTFETDSGSVCCRNLFPESINSTTSECVSCIANDHGPCDLYPGSCCSSKCGLDGICSCISSGDTCDPTAPFYCCGGICGTAGGISTCSDCISDGKSGCGNGAICCGTGALCNASGYCSNSYYTAKVISASSTQSWRNESVKIPSTEYNFLGAAYNGNIYTLTSKGTSSSSKTLYSKPRNWISMCSNRNGTLIGVVSPSNSTANGTVIVSANSGSSWIISRNDTLKYTSIACSYDYSSTTLVTVANGGKIYISKNSGSSWSTVNTAESYTSVAVSTNISKIYAVTSTGSIYMSSNNGSSWSSQTWFSYNFVSVSTSHDGQFILLAPYQKYLMFSTDGGGTWTNIVNSNLTSTSQRWITTACNYYGKYLAVSIESNLNYYYSLDAGTTWVPGILDSSSYPTSLSFYYNGAFLALGTLNGKIWNASLF